MTDFEKSEENKEPDTQQEELPSDENTASEDAVPEEEKVSPLEAAEQEASEFKEKWLRAEAENQNLRQRAKRDVQDARQFAVQKFARDVVEAAENLRRAIASLPEQTEGEDAVVTKMREGIESTERSFLSILERHGIKKEDPQGQTFDPNKHQAMAEQPSEEHEPGSIIQSWTPTWTLHDRLLKPAMVVVSKASDGKKTS